MYFTTLQRPENKIIDNKDKRAFLAFLILFNFNFSIPYWFHWRHS